jgi:hypothetical protein
MERPKGEVRPRTAVFRRLRDDGRSGAAKQIPLNASGKNQRPTIAPKTGGVNPVSALSQT